VRPLLDRLNALFARTGDSIARERRGRVRPSLVRERLVEHCRQAFGFGRVSLFTDHPLLQKSPPRTRLAAGVSRST